MAKTNEQKIEAVGKVIDMYCPDLDIFTKETIMDAVKENISGTAQEVADVVFDTFENKFADTSVVDALLRNVVPKTILYVMRADIIKELS